MKASIVGGSGYAGGEVLRLLLDHPMVEVQQATSESHLGEYVYQQHPNLRKRSQLKFTSRQNLEPCDILFLALPHGEAQKQIGHYASLAPRIVDLSADFRLRDASLYRQFYGEDHAAPDWLQKFVYGLPELHRHEMQGAASISGVGCNAAATILSLYPVVHSGLADTSRPIIVEIKVGSSEGGAGSSSASHHPERSNVMRTFSAFGHRHTAEVIQELGLTDVHLTMTSVDNVRGALAAAHVFVNAGTTEKDLWRIYRAWAESEPFVRLVKDKRGIYRVPEPKILAGTNYVDVGFELDERTGHLVCLAAIDNLMKGAAGSAVQAMNILCGYEETSGLGYGGLHPI